MMEYDNHDPGNGMGDFAEPAGVLAEDSMESSAFDADFWGKATGFESITIPVRPPIKPLAILEKLGPSPFERGGFPLIGFLATTYEKVSSFALERSGYQSPTQHNDSTTDIPGE